MPNAKFVIHVLCKDCIHFYYFTRMKQGIKVSFTLLINGKLLSTGQMSSIQINPYVLEYRIQEQLCSKHVRELYCT